MSKDAVGGVFKTTDIEIYADLYDRRTKIAKLLGASVTEEDSGHANKS